MAESYKPILQHILGLKILQIQMEVGHQAKLQQSDVKFY